MTKRVDERSANDWTYSSATRLQAPITLVGLTALSVEIITNESVWYSMARSASRRVAVTMFRTASWGCRSISGTCL